MTSIWVRTFLFQIATGVAVGLQEEVRQLQVLYPYVNLVPNLLLLFNLHIHLNLLLNMKVTISTAVNFLDQLRDLQRQVSELQVEH